MGLFSKAPPAPVHADAEDASFRSAAIDLYRPGASAWSFVPNLDDRKHRRSPLASMLADNPLTFGPLYRIAMKMGSLPIKVYSREDNGVKKEQPTHAAYQLLRRPNPAMTRSLMISNLVMNLLVHEKGAWLKVRDTSNAVAEIWPIMPQTLRVEPDKRNIIGRFIVQVDGIDTPIAESDVCYFRLMLNDGNYAEGMSPAGPLAVAGSLGGDAINASSDLFRNGFLGNIWLKHKGVLGDKAYRRLTRAIDKARRERFKVPILEEDMDVHDSPGPNDEVLLNAVQEVKTIISEMLGIPKSDDDRKFLQDAINPIADAIEQELERTLMPEFGDGIFPEFAYRDLLRGDPETRAKSHQTKILSAQETPNEARADDNLPPIEGGDQLFVPLNLVPVQQAEETGESGRPRATDTGGGLGGDEGKGTFASEEEAFAARAERNDKWSSFRTSITNRYGEAAARAIRSVLKAEAKEIAAEFTESRSAGRAAEKAMPTVSKLERIIRRRDSEIAKHLRQHLSQTGDNTAGRAAVMVGGDEDLPETVKNELERVFAARAKAVAKTFGDHRAQRVVRIVRNGVESGARANDVAQEIGNAYKRMATHYADGLARTEIAFAHEQAAMAAWAESGISHMEFIFGGGPCTTGRCEEAAMDSPYKLGEKVGDVGFSFEGADSPPLHPGCSCFVVPFIED